MATAHATVSIGGRLVGDGNPVYVIAEAGSNHNGDLQIAKELVRRAAAAGVDAVKFQLFRADGVYPPNAGVVDMPGGPADISEVFAEFELSPEWLDELAAVARDEGIAFLCSAFDEPTLAAVEAVDPEALKIASPELNHLPLLRQAAKTNRPLVCSTGLATLADIDESLAVIREEAPDAAIVLLQCVSAYPLPPEESNLRVMETYRRTFGLPSGLSDHTAEPLRTPAIAGAAGACMIEKHFTLDRTAVGPDHPFAIEPDELESLVRVLRELDGFGPEERMAWVRREYGDDEVERILGSPHKEIQPSELPLYPVDKRSIHAIRDIDAGEVLTTDNVRVLRSERNLTPGLHSRHWETVLGAVTTAPVPCGTGVRWDHLLVRTPAS